MPSVLARDIPGSQLTIAYANYQQDSATRKFLVSATDRAEAISTTIANGDGDADALDYGHPNESRLKVNQITATAVGPDRWMVTVQYVRNRFTGLPQAGGGGNVALFNSRVAYESVQVYCDPSVWADGLPSGPFAYPRDLNTNPAQPPLPYIWNRPVFVIEIPFSTSTNPIASGGALSEEVVHVGQVNSSAVTLFTAAFPAGTLRYDGMTLTSTANSAAALGTVNYYGTKKFSYSTGGFYQQHLEFLTSGVWDFYNLTAYETGAIPS